MYINRTLDPFSGINKKSFFLFGPRSIGKSMLIKKLIREDTLYISLISTDVFLRLSERPSLIKGMIKDYKIVVIDEIQKLPILLDEIHRLIEEKDIHFLLTGSSARKLKREFANLLGGRANQLKLLPLTSFEIKDFYIDKYLLWGGIPRVHLSDDPSFELEGYLQIYLEQEVQIEANIRNLPPFARFLKQAALNNAQLINYSSIASDCGVPAATVKEYYQILVDTLLGFHLEPWLESRKRKAIQTSKFYFFDLGVRNYILGMTALSRETKEWGDLFEHFIINEIRAYLMYRQKRMKMYFWRNTSKHEVDVVIDQILAIEIKSAKKINSSHLHGLKALQEEKIVEKYFIISNDSIERTEEEIDFYPWEIFLKKLWNNEFL